MPIVELVPQFLDKLTDDELKKGSKTEVKNDALSSIVKALKYLTSRVPQQDDKIKALEMFRLKMILRFILWLCAVTRSTSNAEQSGIRQLFETSIIMHCCTVIFG